MAMAPTAAANPAPTDNPPPAPGAGADVGAPPDDEAEDQTEGESPWQPIATVLKNTDTGQYMLVQGDEPEPGEGEPQGPTFPDGPSLLKAMMGVLKSDDGAEQGFAEGFNGNAKNAMSKGPMAA